MATFDNPLSADRGVAYNPQDVLGDRHRNRPVRWSHRYELLLDLYLSGARTHEIAEHLGYSRHRVSCIINSPLFKEKEWERLHEPRGGCAGAYLEAVRRDAVENFRFLVEQRDDKSLPAQLRISAAREIQRALERVVPAPN